jgi:uncharacterized protein YoxC
MPPTLDTTNTWLTVIAIAVIVQTLLMLGVAVIAWQTMQRTASMLEQLEAKHLSPLSARVTAVADDVQEVISRVRRADDAVRAQLTRIDSVAHVAGHALGSAGHAIGSKVWPVVGLSRAVTAALRAFASRPSTVPSPEPPRAARVTPR